MRKIVGLLLLAALCMGQQCGELTKSLSDAIAEGDGQAMPSTTEPVRGSDDSADGAPDADASICRDTCFDECIVTADDVCTDEEGTLCRSAWASYCHTDCERQCHSATSSDSSDSATATDAPE